MIPDERLSSAPVRGALFNPWDRRVHVSRHWGPLALQDPSQGLAVKLWQARIEQGSDEILLSAFGVPEYVWHTHGVDVLEVSLAFDQNARPLVAFADVNGDSWLRWFDPAPNDVVDYALDGVTPRVTLDDHRPFNGANSDVILGYVRDGIVRYRQLRDRFTVEYTPPIGPGGSPAFADGLHHISMNSALRLEFLAMGGPGDTDWTLPQVIEELARRSGLPPEKVGLAMMDWNQVVRGYTVTGQNPCYANIAVLSQAFFFDPSEADGRVHFVPRGRDAAGLVTEDDMIEEENKETKRDTMGVPRVLHLNYYDVAGGLNTDKQLSERPEGTRAIGEQSMQTPIVMTADEAATVVAKAHASMTEAALGELEFSLPDNWLRLTQSDPLWIYRDGKMVRAMIVEVQTDDGEQRYRLVRDRQSIHSMQVQGMPAAPVTRPPSGIVGPTLIEFLDIKPLRDSHDVLGFYVAVSGVYAAWQGALVELSLDGGATYIDSSTARADVIMGALVSPLGDHPQAFPDEVNDFDVQIDTPDALLESTTLAGMLNRANLAIVGDEIIAFAEADETSEGVWNLSHFLRGRKGTTTEAHAIGERFVLLSGVAFIPADLQWLGQQLTFRATSIGRPVDEATIITVPFTGQSQVEHAPAYLQARRDGSDLVASWQGVGRLGGGVHVALGAYFAGYRVTLDDGSVTEIHDTLDQSLTTSLAAFSSPVTVRVQQRNQITGLGPHIEAIV